MGWEWDGCSHSCWGEGNWRTKITLAVKRKKNSISMGMEWPSVCFSLFGIPAELFQILKDDAVKCCTQYASKFGKLSSGHRTGKGQFSFQSQRKAMPKNVQTMVQLFSFHIASKVTLKTLQARLQQYVN